VPEHEGTVDDEAAHPAFAVVVRVRAADADRRDAYQHVTGCWVGDGAFFDLDAAGSDENGSPHVFGD
jgi:hypothetical protein